MIPLLTYVDSKINFLHRHTVIIVQLLARGIRMSASSQLNDFWPSIRGHGNRRIFPLIGHHLGSRASWSVGGHTLRPAQLTILHSSAAAVVRASGVHEVFTYRLPFLPAPHVLHRLPCLSRRADTTLGFLPPASMHGGRNHAAENSAPRAPHTTVRHSTSAFFFEREGTKFENICLYPLGAFTYAGG